MAFRKLTPDVRERLLQAVRLGATHELACMYAGVSVDSFARYRTDADFAEDVKRAEGQAALGWLAKIEKAATDGNWQAAAWKLERRYPDVYGRRVQQLEHSGPGGGPIPLAPVPDATIAAVLARHAGRAADRGTDDDGHRNGSHRGAGALPP